MENDRLLDFVNVIQGGKSFKSKSQRGLAIINSSEKFSGWQNNVLIKDVFICQRCFGYEKGAKVAHRLYDPFTHPELAYEVENGACLCERCESDYVKKHGVIRTSKRQFDNFVKDYYPNI